MPVKYSKEEIRTFDRKEVIGIVQSFIKSYSLLNEGTEKELDLSWVKKEVLKVYELVDEVLDLNAERKEKRLKGESNKAQEEAPF